MVRYITIILIVFRTMAYSQNDSIAPKKELKLGVSNFGLFLSGEIYFKNKISTELIGTSFFGIMNTLHIGPKVIIKKSNLNLWKLGLSGTFINMNFTEYGEKDFGISLTSEFSRRKLSIGFSTVILYKSNKLNFYVIHTSICYRWKR
jgi:hypothetical protein